MKRRTIAAVAAVPPPLKIDIGCGSKKREGFVGIDRIAFEGVDHVLEVGRSRWPLANGSVEEAHTSHFVEHLTAWERVHFANELHRVLVAGGKATIIVPHWSSGRAYGDPTHQWPPMTEFWFHYLDRAWRLDQAPHTDKKNDKRGFDCDFLFTVGVGMNPALGTRNQDYQHFAMANYREAVWDLHATLTKRVIA